ncbi:hypothetical protein HPB51_013389 [Rhipicephalus microplus]|uniref:Uncharacterized protein n=1 Tax=Rhipicephalus microplus TaxID=6941 RepID=A0A9J6EGS7_RHIMP|nr:hypothetical protein HPB51_013389 [Rhipicephalus microplus]
MTNCGAPAPCGGSGGVAALQIAVAVQRRGVPASEDEAKHAGLVHRRQHRRAVLPAADERWLQLVQTCKDATLVEVIQTAEDIWKSKEVILVLHAGLGDIQNNDASHDFTDKLKSQIPSSTATAIGHFCVFYGVSKLEPKVNAMRTKFKTWNKNLRTPTRQPVVSFSTEEIRRDPLPSSRNPILNAGEGALSSGVLFNPDEHAGKLLMLDVCSCVTSGEEGEASEVTCTEMFQQYNTAHRANSYRLCQPPAPIPDSYRRLPPVNSNSFDAPIRSTAARRRVGVLSLVCDLDVTRRPLLLYDDARPPRSILIRKTKRGRF